MKANFNNAIFILGIGALVIIGMFFRAGGFAEAWENKTGGILIACTVIAGLTLRALFKGDEESESPDQGDE